MSYPARAEGLGKLDNTLLFSCTISLSWRRENWREFVARISSMIRRIVKIWEVVGRFLPKPFWSFLRTFTTSGRWKQNIIKLNSNSNKSYTAVVRDDSEVPFAKGKLKPSVYFSIALCLYSLLHNWRSISLNFFVIHTYRGISLRPTANLILIALRTVSSTSTWKCPSIMSSWS